MNENTPTHPIASHATDDGGHTSYVFHAKYIGQEVAIFKDKQNHKADAALFIGALDLLAACERVAERGCDCPAHDDTGEAIECEVCQCRRAIAKTRGES